MLCQLYLKKSRKNKVFTKYQMKKGNKLNGFLSISQVRILEKNKPWIKLWYLSKSYVMKYSLIIFYSITLVHNSLLTFLFPCFLQGVWSSNSLGKPWQGRKARIYGSADGTCTVTFAPSGIFSSGKSIYRACEYM